MTLMELIQSKLPSHLLGAEIRIRPQSGDYIDADVVGLAEPIRIMGIEAAVAGVEMRGPPVTIRVDPNAPDDYWQLLTEKVAAELHEAHRNGAKLLGDAMYGVGVDYAKPEKPAPPRIKPGQFANLFGMTQAQASRMVRDLDPNQRTRPSAGGLAANGPLGVCATIDQHSGVGCGDLAHLRDARCLRWRQVDAAVHGLDPDCIVKLPPPVRMISAFYKDTTGRIRPAVVIAIHSDATADLRVSVETPKRGLPGTHWIVPTMDNGMLLQAVPYHDAKMGLPLPPGTWSLPEGSGLSFW